MSVIPVLKGVHRVTQTISDAFPESCEHFSSETNYSIVVSDHHFCLKVVFDCDSVTQNSCTYVLR